MNETSKDGFVPRHLRGKRVGPDLCDWRLIADHGSYDNRFETVCHNPIDVSSGIKLCKDHIRRIGYLSGLLSRKRAQEWLDGKSDRDLEQAREEIARQRRTIAWQAKKLRGEPTEYGPEEPPATPTRGVIYALLNGYNVKIGWTSNLERRLREYPPSTQLLVTYPGKRKDETALKRKFAHLATHGNEWFPYAPQITEWVDSMKAQHGDPDPDLACGPTKTYVPRIAEDKPMVKPKYWTGKTA